MASPFDTMENPHKAVKQIVSILHVGGSSVGFRVKLDKGLLGDVILDAVKLSIPKILKEIPVENLILSNGLWLSKLELSQRKQITDYSNNKEVVNSLQYHIYGLERKYRQENSTNIFEIAFEFMHNGRLKQLSGYLQAQDPQHAVGLGRSYIAQVYGLNPFDITCPYVEPHYENVNWGVQNPLLAIRLTLDTKWNKTILPKI